MWASTQWAKACLKFEFNENCGGKSPEIGSCRIKVDEQDFYFVYFQIPEIHIKLSDENLKFSLYPYQFSYVYKRNIILCLFVFCR